jgi:D-alanyl-D-alanine carboxypeptidase/D-alanyl-D-alanine-endopeptidase (penicillin-binding protein 4)
MTHHSPPLSTMAATMMKLSQNLYAETFLKSMARDGGIGTAENGRTAERTLLATWGVQPSDAVIADGSGLSRYNLMTAQALVRVLGRVAADESMREPFMASLPIAGRDGTLSNRMRGTPAEGNARAKTGSLSNIRALSGYVRSADDELLAYSLIANNFGGSADLVERTMDTIVASLAAFRR